jgi:catechol-2,3-dioxygenase
MNIINNIHNNSDKYDTSHSFLKKITYQNRFEENILPFNKQMAAWDKNKNNNVLGLMKMTNTYPRVINHVGVSVISLNKAVNWYEEVLGFSVLRRETIRAEDSSLISSNFKRIFGANFKRVQVAWLSSAIRSVLNYLNLRTLGQSNVPIISSIGKLVFSIFVLLILT